jgi:hypothetical protein
MATKSLTLSNLHRSEARVKVRRPLSRVLTPDVLNLHSQNGNPSKINSEPVAYFPHRKRHRQPTIIYQHLTTN